MNRLRGFTLVEILIVVVLLGVLAAIVIPTIANSGTSARESTLLANLNLLRRFVMIYTGHHCEVAPGYPDGDTTAAPTNVAFADQATQASNRQGQTAPDGTPGFGYGPYLSKVPTNPLNGLDTIQMLADGQAFPAAPDSSHGWIYKAETREIRPDNIGNGSAGRAYYEY